VEGESGIGGGEVSLKNAKAKGSRLEREVRDIFIRAGYFVVKAGGSLGPADLIALYPGIGQVRFIQVKANRWPPPVERGELQRLALECASLEQDWRVMVYRKRDRKAWEIRWVESDGFKAERT
jgi:Holliday junction resolvase